MKITVSIEGEPIEVADGLERVGRAIRTEFNSDDELADHIEDYDLDLNLMRKVWNRITVKAKGALRVMFELADGVTKDEIVQLLPNVLANTRDLGGALSSITRVAKGLSIRNYQTAIYDKFEAEDGQILYRLSDAAREQLRTIMP